MPFTTTLLPHECKDKADIRCQIDQIDKEIISLFAQRSLYVAEIVNYKTDVESVVAKDRKEEVIRLRGEWAEQAGLDKTTFQQIFSCLINHNIQIELALFDKK